MKKADNFDATKWLVENKVTFQSRLNEDEAYLSPSMQKQFNMIVSTLKKAKSQEDIDQVHSNLMLLPKKLTKIFIDKLVNMGLANREGEGKYSLDYDDGLDESNLKEAEGKSKNDLLSFIKQNQAEAADEVGAIRLEDIMIDDLGDVGASAIFDDNGDEMEGGVSFRYSEDVDDDFEGENGDEPRPIEVAGKQLMYIGYNI